MNEYLLNKIREFKIMIVDNLDEIEHLENKIARLKLNNARYKEQIANIEKLLD